MKNLKLSAFLCFMLIPVAAFATIRYDISPLELYQTLSPVEPAPRRIKRRLPLPKNPTDLSQELRKRLAKGKLNVGKLADHPLLTLNEEELYQQVRNMKKQLFEDPNDDALDAQLAEAFEKLKLAQDVRLHLNGAWEEVKKDLRHKKHPGHKRNLQGSLFTPPLLVEPQLNEVLFQLVLEDKKSPRSLRHRRNIKGSLFEPPIKQAAPKPQINSRHRRSVATYIG